VAQRLNRVAQRRRQRPRLHSCTGSTCSSQANPAGGRLSPHSCPAAPTTSAGAGPTLTAFLQAQAAEQQPAPVALQVRSGRLVTNPAQLPQVVAEFWAEVCRTCALTLGTGSWNSCLQATSGSRQKRTSNLAQKPSPWRNYIRAAQVKSQPGKAPGWDGIPADLYRKFWSAIRRHHHGGPLRRHRPDRVGVAGVPGGRESSQCSTRKATPCKQPGNYRPITLLCSDYCILTKVLANRLGPALGCVISPEQAPDDRSQRAIPTPPLPPPTQAEQQGSSGVPGLRQGV
jgi:hypothetical protein